VKTEMLEEKSATFTNCPSQILNGQPPDWIQSYLVGTVCHGAFRFVFLLEYFTFLFGGKALLNKLTSESTISLKLSVSGNICWPSETYSFF
jgi:hypothetical protein